MLGLLYQVLNGLLRAMNWVLSIIVQVLNWSQDQITKLAAFPQADLSGLRWMVWLLAVIFIVGSLIVALYRWAPYFKGLFAPLWAAILALTLAQIPRIIAIVVGSIVAWFVFSGVWSYVALFILHYIPK